MQSNFRLFKIEDSYARVQEILSAKDTNYEEKDSIPSRESLTYSNGFFINWVGAIFVDIRDSSGMAKRNTKPTLAKIYRSFISEVVAVMNGNPLLEEITIEGDCVGGVFDSSTKSDVQKIINTCAKIHSVINMLNHQLSKKGIECFKVGIGCDIGPALMIKAGYSGSGINEIAWMGDILNNAAKMSGYGNKEWHDKTVMISGTVNQNASDHQKSLFTYNSQRSCYHSNFVMPDFEEYYESR